MKGRDQQVSTEPAFRSVYVPTGGSAFTKQPSPLRAMYCDIDLNPFPGIQVSPFYLLRCFDASLLQSIEPVLFVDSPLSLETHLVLFAGRADLLSRKLGSTPGSGESDRTTLQGRGRPKPNDLTQVPRAARVKA